jgi:hypothetical protein
MEYKTGDPEYIHTCFVCKSIHNLDLDCPEAALVSRISQLEARVEELEGERDGYEKRAIRFAKGVRETEAEFQRLVRYAGLLDKHADIESAPQHLTRKVGDARKALSPETREAIENL